MSVTAAAMLSNLEDAINAFLANGALRRYETNGMTFERADLTKLMDARDRLKLEVTMTTTQPSRLADLGGGNST